MPGSCHEMYFQNLRVMPRRYGELQVLFGLELNILNRNGDVDLSEETCKELDVTIASIHMPCYHEEDPEAHLEAYLNVMQKHYISIIGHQDDGRYPVDYREMLLWCREYEAPVIINSDAHVDVGLGEHELAWNLLREEGFP